MKFNYKYQNGYLVPIISISIQGPSGISHGIRVLVDSGAIYSIFPESHALCIGLDTGKLPDQPIIFGSGTVIGKKGKIVYNINGYKFQDYAVFVKGMAFERNLALLGRLDVFKKFKSVVFNERAMHPYLYLAV